MSSVSRYISRLKDGSESAVFYLWGQFEKPLLRVAHRYLRHSPKRVADEDDVVVQAFEKLRLGAVQGRFSKLRRRDDIWPLLVRLTRNVALNQVRDLSREKRGAANVKGESAFARNGEGGIGETIADQPTPDMVAAMNDTCLYLLRQLDSEMQEIVRQRGEGYQVAEIAASMGCSKATIERRLRVIRRIVSRDIQDG